MIRLEVEQVPWGDPSDRIFAYRVKLTAGECVGYGCHHATRDLADMDIEEFIEFMCRLQFTSKGVWSYDEDGAVTWRAASQRGVLSDAIQLAARSGRDREEGAVRARPNGADSLAVVGVDPSSGPNTASLSLLPTTAEGIQAAAKLAGIFRDAPFNRKKDG